MQFVGLYLCAEHKSHRKRRGLFLLFLDASAGQCAGANPADPLAYLPAPSNANAACGTSTHSPFYGSPSHVGISFSQSAVLNPGVYCGGISIDGTLLSSITFNPGTYILRDGSSGTGGLNLSLSLFSSITGYGVTFYNEGPSQGLTVNEPLSGGIISVTNINLTAPTSGEFQGVLFFQQHGVTAPATFIANVGSGGNLEGGVYIPDGSVNYELSALSASYNFLVAKDINILGDFLSSFANDYSSLDSGAPLAGSVSLVQ